MNIRKIVFILLALLGVTGGAVRAQSTEPVTDLFKFCSEQKGFNLLGMYDINWNINVFNETEFKMIHDLGFNFVRLPLDFRTYTKPGDWNTFYLTKVAEIDKAIQWGEKYGIHVCVNLHRAPGYCVNPTTTLPANQQLNLWTDAVAQDAFVNHWKFFANRYKDIPASRLSFNLVNEPGNVTSDVYVSVMRKAIDAIHQISPERIVFVDVVDNGLILALKGEPNVAQSIHCYDPSSLTHYKAEWVNQGGNWTVPTWPILWISNYLFGPWKNDWKSPLVFQGNFAKGTEIIVNVHQVSMQSTLTIKAGIKSIMNKTFYCTKDLGTDFTTIVDQGWGFQNISDKDYTVILPEAATSISFENTAGDWMTLNSISIRQGTNLSKYTLSNNTWGIKQASYKIDESGKIMTLDGKDVLPFDSYRKNVAISKDNQIPFMVQEFGVYNKTPHDVTIGFLTDLSKFFRENNIGWALWNFTGSFGIINSDRTDVQYETYNGTYKLDREMLNALTQPATSAAVEFQLNESLAIYPLPAKEQLYVSSKELKGNTQFDIIDITGRIIRHFSVASTGSQAVCLDISGIRPNIYLLKASANGKTYTAKFLIGQ
ncbi:MAG: cellulase family glycosylhydrolase [Candidatus Saccharibacteria bacterium]